MLRCSIAVIGIRGYCAQFMEWVQPEHREIHDYLSHWGRWLKHSAAQGHCESIEHQFKSPQCWYPQEPQAEPADPFKASTVESLMRIVPKQSRKLLKFKYVYRADQAWISRRLHLRDYPQALYTARQIVLNLTRHKLTPTLHGRFHNLCTPGNPEFSPQQG